MNAQWMPSEQQTRIADNMLAELANLTAALRMYKDGNRLAAEVLWQNTSKHSYLVEVGVRDAARLLLTDDDE
jgi:hypothetical protein